MRFDAVSGCDDWYEPRPGRFAAHFVVAHRMRLTVLFKRIANRTRLSYNMTEEPKNTTLTPMILRKRVNLSQRQVAQALDIRPQTVGDWEKGGVPHLPPSKIKKLCEIYRCSIDDLIEAFESPRADAI